jgi:hypothetical protein
MPCLTSQRENIMEDNYEEQSKGKSVREQVRSAHPHTFSFSLFYISQIM